MRRSKQVREGPRVEAFILLTGRGERLRNETIKTIEAAGGRPLHTYPPGTIIAEIPLKTVGRLQAAAGIRSIDIEAIEETRRRTASPDAAFAIAAWNRHLKRRQEGRSGR